MLTTVVKLFIVLFTWFKNKINLKKKKFLLSTFIYTLIKLKEEGTTKKSIRLRRIFQNAIDWFSPLNNCTTTITRYTYILHQYQRLHIQPFPPEPPDDRLRSQPLPISSSLYLFPRISSRRRRLLCSRKVVLLKSDFVCVPLPVTVYCWRRTTTATRDCSQSFYRNREKKWRTGWFILGRGVYEELRVARDLNLESSAVANLATGD